jgi:hypothetical protein
MKITLPQLQHAFDAVVLLVAVQRAAVAAVDAVQHRGDAQQSRHVGVDVASHLELEPAVAVGGNHLFQRLGQAVAHGLVGVGAGDRVDEADRVARGDVFRRPQAAQEGVEIEAHHVGCQRRGLDAGPVAADHFEEGLAQRAAQRIEQGTVDQRRAVVGHQAVQALLRTAADLRLVVARKVAEGTVDPAVRIEPACNAQRLAQLLEVVVVAERGVLVEPLRRHQLGRQALCLCAVGQPDARTHEGLRRGGERDHAEAKRHAQLDRALEQLDRFNSEQWRRVHSIPSNL